MGRRIAVALAEAGKRVEVREHGKVVNTPAALKTLATKLARNGCSLRFCYEAGPCGYGIQRQLSEAGHECVVVGPSLIPRKAGERIKTDRRDAINLAQLHRAGELSPVWVPAHEAIRDLVRARLAAVRTVRQARQQLSGFLLRHGHRYNRPAWTLMHRRWLAGLSFEHAAHYIVLEDCIAAVEAATVRDRPLFSGCDFHLIRICGCERPSFTSCRLPFAGRPRNSLSLAAAACERESWPSERPEGGNHGRGQLGNIPAPVLWHDPERAFVVSDRMARIRRARSCPVALALSKP